MSGKGDGESEQSKTCALSRLVAKTVDVSRHCVRGARLLLSPACRCWSAALREASPYRRRKCVDRDAAFGEPATQRAAVTPHADQADCPEHVLERESPSERRERVVGAAARCQQVEDRADRQDADERGHEAADVDDAAGAAESGGGVL